MKRIPSLVFLDDADAVVLMRALRRSIIHVSRARPEFLDYATVAAVMEGDLPSGDDLRAVVREGRIDESALLDKLSIDGRVRVERALGLRDIPGRQRGASIAVELCADDHRRFIEYVRAEMQTRDLRAIELAEGAGISVHDVSNLLARFGPRPGTYVYCAVARSLDFDPAAASTSRRGRATWRAAFEIATARNLQVSVPQAKRASRGERELIRAAIMQRFEDSDLSIGDVNAVLREPKTFETVRRNNEPTLNDLILVGRALGMTPHEMTARIGPDRQATVRAQLAGMHAQRPTARPNGHFGQANAAVDLDDLTWRELREIVVGSLSREFKRFDLAKAAGVSPSIITRFLSGERKLSLPNLLKITGALPQPIRKWPIEGTDEWVAKQLSDPAQYLAGVGDITMRDLEALFGELPTREWAAHHIDPATYARLPEGAKRAVDARRAGQAADGVGERRRVDRSTPAGR